MPTDPACPVCHGTNRHTYTATLRLGTTVTHTYTYVACCPRCTATAHWLACNAAATTRNHR